MFHHSVALLLVIAPVAFAQSKDQEKKHADHMEHRFDNPEQLAKGFDDPARDAWQLPDRVLAALDLKPGQTVADIGSGTGYFTVRLAKLGTVAKVYAADIEPSMGTYIQKRAAAAGLTNIVAVQAAADTPNLPEPVDLVLIVNTYHHIGDREVYFRRLAKSLKPGGRVAIIDFKLDSPEGPPKEFRFPVEKFKAEMAKAGYKLAKQYDFLPRQQFLIFEVAGAKS
jgi:cyclopropane fatty-acyl-phospholipid synthase-like methyltransferase